MGILIVEDDMIISLVIERMMSRLGYEVSAKATSGEDAVQLAKKYRPDLILMDIRLNGEIDGIEAMRQIKSETDIPVIYITGNTDKQNRERAAETDYVAFLTKPITMNALKRSIESSSKIKSVA